jgi:catechol 2,3-dioxygenase-like lactoylglutathione lyase family enzyme
MNSHLAHVTLLVKDYDEAIEFFVKKLHFTLIEDTKLNKTKRWLLIRPSDLEGCNLLLAKAVTEEQETRVGNQTGGRVFLFIYTNNFRRDYQNLIDQKVTIVRKPVDEPYGMIAVFKDLYGNLWDLIEPRNKAGEDGMLNISKES